MKCIKYKKTGSFLKGATRHVKQFLGGQSFRLFFLEKDYKKRTPKTLKMASKNLRDIRNTLLKLKVERLFLRVLKEDLFYFL